MDVDGAAFAAANQTLAWSDQEHGMVAYRKRDGAWFGIVRIASSIAPGGRYEICLVGGGSCSLRFPTVTSAMAYVDRLYADSRCDAIAFAEAPAPWGHGPELAP